MTQQQHQPITSVAYLKNALVPSARHVDVIDPTAQPITLAQLAPTDWHHPYVCFANGMPVLRADWHHPVTAGQQIAFVDVNAIPQGGGGGGGSNPMRTVAMLAVMYYSGGMGGAMLGIEGAAAVGGFGVAVANAVVTMAGIALVNAVLPAAKPLSVNSAPDPSPTYSLQAQGNMARLDAAIPEQFGRLKAYPDFAAQPYGEYSGNEFFLYQLLCLGVGEFDIEGLYIEDTSIENFTDITYEVVAPNGTVSLFPVDVVTSDEVSGFDMTGMRAATYVQSGTTVTITYEDHAFAMSDDVYLSFDGSNLSDGVYTITNVTVDDLTVTVATSGTSSGSVSMGDVYGPYTANATDTTANYLGFDLIMSRGLYYANDDGSLSTKSVTVVFEARAINYAGVATGSWVTLGTETYSAATTTAQRVSYKYAVTSGRYEARVRRTDTKDTSSRAGHDVSWGGLRAYLTDDTQTFGDVTLIAMRMQASNSLSSSSSRKVNVIATRKLPVWNGTTWSANTATRSPAWAFAYICKSVGLTDSEIDLAGLLTLANTWATRGDHFDARFDNFVSFWEAVTKVGYAGRAKPFMQGGVMRLVRDQAATVPTAMFTMRNIVKGSFSVNYLMPTDDTADAVKVKYWDNTAWASYTVKAKLSDSTAEKYAVVDMFGVTDRDQAYREGMYIAAANRYRRKAITFTTEMEGGIPSLMDLIWVQHDLPGWGQGGEVVAWNATTLTATLSETLTWTTGSNHYMVWRDADGSPVGPYLVTQGSSADQVVFAETPSIEPYVDQAQERTHFAFGWADTVVQPARLLSAKPSGMTRWVIECVGESSNVHTAEDGAITPTVTTSQLGNFTATPLLTGLVLKASTSTRRVIDVSWAATAWADTYYVEQSLDAGNTWTRIAETSQTSCQASVARGTTCLIRAAAVGTAKGDWVQASYTMANLPQVAYFAVAVQGGLIAGTWAEVSDTELAGYEVRTDASWGAPGALFTGMALSATWAPPAAGVQTTYYIKAFDTSGDYSATAATAVITVAAPSAPEYFSLSFGTASIEAKWSAPNLSSTQHPLERVELSWADAFTSVIDAKKATTATFGWLTAGIYTLYARYIDVAGNIGSVSQAMLQVLPPAQPTMTAVETQVNAVTLRWQNAKTSQPIKSYAIWYGEAGTLLANATFYGSAGADSRSDILFYRSSGSKVAYLVAEDVAGNLSAARKIDLSITMPNNFVLATEYYEDWQNTELTNATIVGGSTGQIILPAYDGRTWGERLSNSGWTTAQQKVDAGYPVVIQPVPSNGKHVEQHDLGKVLSIGVVRVKPTLQSSVAGYTATIRIRGSNGDSNTSWQNWLTGESASISNFRYLEVEYSVASDGKGFVVLDDLYVIVEISEVTEAATLNLVATDTAGTVFVCTKSFLDVRNVFVSPLNSPNIARWNTVIDDSTLPAKVYVQAWDTSNNRVSGTVSLLISGV